jgi:hypothetical protein
VRSQTAQLMCKRQSLPRSWWCRGQLHRSGRTSYSAAWVAARSRHPSAHDSSCPSLAHSRDLTPSGARGTGCHGLIRSARTQDVSGCCCLTAAASVRNSHGLGSSGCVPWCASNSCIPSRTDHLAQHTSAAAASAVRNTLETRCTSEHSCPSPVGVQRLAQPPWRIPGSAEARTQYHYLLVALVVWCPSGASLCCALLYTEQSCSVARFRARHGLSLFTRKVRCVVMCFPKAASLRQRQNGWSALFSRFCRRRIARCRCR